MLNEFVSVVRSKLGVPWKDANDSLNSFRVLCPSPAPITIDTHQSALRIAERYWYEIYDALIAAAALQSGCERFYSEDLRMDTFLSGN